MVQIPSGSTVAPFVTNPSCGCFRYNNTRKRESERFELYPVRNKPFLSKISIYFWPKLSELKLSFFVYPGDSIVTFRHLNRIFDERSTKFTWITLTFDIIIIVEPSRSPDCRRHDGLVDDATRKTLLAPNPWRWNHGHQRQFHAWKRSLLPHEESHWEWWVLHSNFQLYPWDLAKNDFWEVSWHKDRNDLRPAIVCPF